MAGRGQARARCADNVRAWGRDATRRSTRVGNFRIFGKFSYEHLRAITQTPRRLVPEIVLVDGAAGLRSDGCLPWCFLSTVATIATRGAVPGGAVLGVWRQAGRRGSEEAPTQRREQEVFRAERPRAATLPKGLRPRGPGSRKPGPFSRTGTLEPAPRGGPVPWRPTETRRPLQDFSPEAGPPAFELLDVLGR